MIVASATELQIEVDIPQVVQIPMGKIKLYEDTWTIVSVLEMSEIVEQSDALRKSIKRMIDLTNLRGSGEWNDIFEKLSQSFEMIDKEKHLFIPVTPTSSRQKRGLVNIVGTLNKFLWGTLDANDADYYNTEIDKLYDSTNQISKIVHNQTIIVQQTIKDVLKYVREFENATEEFASVTYYNLALQSIEISLMHYERVLHDLTIAVSNAQRGIITPILMSPDHLQKALKHLQNEFHTHNIYLDNTLENYYAFLQLAEITLYINGTRIVSILKLPIVEEMSYTLYSFLSLPTEKFEKKYFYIEVPHKYICYSEDNLYFTFLSSMYDCKAVYNEKICKREFITRPIHTASKCQLGLKNNDSNDCSLKLFSLDSDFLYKIKTNVWYIIPMSELYLNLICTKYIKSIKISEPTILTLFRGCILTNNDYTLRSAMELNSVVDYKKVYMNVSVPNISDIELPRLRIRDFSDLQKDALNLEQTEQLISDYENLRRKHNVMESLEFTAHVGGYVILIAIILALILYKLNIHSTILKYCCCKNKYRHENNESVQKMQSTNYPTAPLLVPSSPTVRS